VPERPRASFTALEIGSVLARDNSMVEANNNLLIIEDNKILKFEDMVFFRFRISSEQATPEFLAQELHGSWQTEASADVKFGGRGLCPHDGTSSKKSHFNLFLALQTHALQIYCYYYKT